MKKFLLIFPFILSSCSHNISGDPEFPTGYHTGHLYRTKQPIILRNANSWSSSSEASRLYRANDPKLRNNPIVFFNRREFHDTQIPVGTIFQVVSVRNTLTSLNGYEVIVSAKKIPTTFWETGGRYRLDKLDPDASAFKMAKRDPDLLEHVPN